MKKRLFLMLTTLSLLIITILSLIMTSQTNQGAFTANVVFEPSLDNTQLCSNTTIKSIWESFLYEPFENISIDTQIFKNESNVSECIRFRASKNINDTYYYLSINRLSFSLFSVNLDFSIISSFVMKPSELYKLKVINNNSLTEEEKKDIIELDINDLDKKIIFKERNISLQEAKTDLTRIYKPLVKDFSNSSITDDDNLGKMYIFTESDILNSSNTQIQNYTSRSNNAAALEKYEFSVFSFIKMKSEFNSSFYDYKFNSYNCTPIWKEIEGECYENNERYVYSYSENGCYNYTFQEKPASRYQACDFGKDGIKGDESRIQSKNTKNLAFIIENKTLNYSLYRANNETKRINILSDNKTIIEIDYNFSKYILDLNNITIQKQSENDTLGYLLVKGFNSEKTLYLDKVNANSTEICIRDREVEDISELTSNCTSANEIRLTCPGNSSYITCTIENSSVKITGLRHSAVKELSPSEVIPVICAENWVCTEFDACNPQTLLTSRTCIDVNECNSTLYKPVESQSCTPACTSNWNCTAFTPEVCPKNQTQYRTCTDLTSCNDLLSKPLEVNSCVYTEKPKPNYTFLIIILVIVLTLLGVVFALFYLLTHDKFSGDTLPRDMYI